MKRIEVKVPGEEEGMKLHARDFDNPSLLSVFKLGLPSQGLMGFYLNPKCGKT